MDIKTTVAAYDFLSLEKKWQTYWVEEKIFRTIEDEKKPKYYILDMFPYPSGDGLHVGHTEGYTATDILARFKRMRGFCVLHPMGWDAFGLPAEQYALKTGTHPRITTEKNVGRFKEQIIAMGFSYDWDREISTTWPEYYKWTQWIFSKLYERGLAYESFEAVNFCPTLGTVLANEEVIDGKSEVGGYPVIRKPMRQWVLKITEYAERLLSDLDLVEWPESIKDMQRNWIGRSEGADVRFALEKSPREFLEVFTTRPDTIFGVTFMAIAPEHPLVEKFVTSEQKAAVDSYIEVARNRSDLERTGTNKDKTGMATGGFVLHPITQKKIPVYVADYVLMTYGKGAVMGVPAHDERDHEFAKKYSLPIVRVLTGGEEDIQKQSHCGDGELINSDFLNGLSKDDAIKKIIERFEKDGVGEKRVTYKLRDWLFSRQRYWGEPFPIAHDSEGKAYLISEKDLPIVLPDLQEFKPSGTGESPLALAKDWLEIEHNGKKLRRETNTMPQWAGSCWYYLRFVDPKNHKEIFSKDKEKYWLPVDLYVGGAEHAVLHLLYARFWHKVLYDLGVVSTKEPFQKLFNPGIVLGNDGVRMSKSRGNVVRPDEVIAEYGSDALRLYEMFMGPLEASKPWQTTGIIGCQRFLKRIWHAFVDESTGELANKISKEKLTQDSEILQKATHKTIKKMTQDTEELKLNTAISSMMELLNVIYKEENFSREFVNIFLRLLSPFAPHISEEIWQKLTHSGKTMAYEAWPTYDEALCQDDTITVSVQVNGKLRGTLVISVQSTQEEVVCLAQKDQGVMRHLDGKTIRKTIYVPGKIVNFVVG